MELKGRDREAVLGEVEGRYPDVGERDVLYTVYDGCHGPAGAVITVNGSPPRGVFMMDFSFQVLVTIIAGKVRHVQRPGPMDPETPNTKTYRKLWPVFEKIRKNPGRARGERVTRARGVDYEGVIDAARSLVAMDEPEPEYLRGICELIDRLFPRPDRDAEDRIKSIEAEVDFCGVEFSEYVAAHGLGNPTAEGVKLGRILIGNGSDYAKAAFEVVFRGMTVEEEEPDELAEKSAAAFTVTGSHGVVEVDADDGKVVTVVKSCSCGQKGCGYGSFSFDVREWKKKYPGEALAGKTVDILDLGYWDRDCVYEGPDEQWRKEFRS